MPTDGPEADGTLAWDATTMVVVEVGAGGRTGLGYTYAPAATAALVKDVLAPLVEGVDPAEVEACWHTLQHQVRNFGREGIAALAISAVDTALWDLRARLLDVPLRELLGAARADVPVYGSGGFTTYDDARLTAQLEGWLDAGCRWVKIKIGESRGANEHRDVARVRQVRDVVGEQVGVFVDANGGYTATQAVRVARRLADVDVTWFEEPVSSDDLAGLRFVREHVDADVAAGEYAFHPQYVERMLAAGAVDCVQVDVTRCGGYTGWRQAVAIAAAHGVEMSAHCAPALSAPACAATPHARHLEWFHDHVRLEPMLLDGVPPVRDGRLVLGDAPGHGLTLRPAAEEYRVR